MHSFPGGADTEFINTNSDDRGGTRLGDTLFASVPDSEFISADFDDISPIAGGLGCEVFDFFNDQASFFGEPLQAGVQVRTHSRKESKSLWMASAIAKENAMKKNRREHLNPRRKKLYLEATGISSLGKKRKTAAKCSATIATSATLKIPVRTGPIPRLIKSVTVPRVARSIRLPRPPRNNQREGHRVDAAHVFSANKNIHGDDKKSCHGHGENPKAGVVMKVCSQT